METTLKRAKRPKRPYSPTTHDKWQVFPAQAKASNANPLPVEAKSPESKRKVQKLNNGVAAVPVPSIPEPPPLLLDLKQMCDICDDPGDEHLTLICDGCPTMRHTYCCAPPLDAVPEGDVSWFCHGVNCRQQAKQNSKPLGATATGPLKLRINMGAPKLANHGDALPSFSPPRLSPPPVLSQTPPSLEQMLPCEGRGKRGHGAAKHASQTPPSLEQVLPCEGGGKRGHGAAKHAKTSKTADLDTDVTVSDKEEGFDLAAESASNGAAVLMQDEGDICGKQHSANGTGRTRRVARQRGLVAQQSSGLHAARDGQTAADMAVVQQPAEDIAAAAEESHQVTAAVLEARCDRCDDPGDEHLTLLCDGCDVVRHTYCCIPALTEVPAEDDAWFCGTCGKLEEEEATPAPSAPSAPIALAASPAPLAPPPSPSPSAPSAPPPSSPDVIKAMRDDELLQELRNQGHGAEIASDASLHSVMRQFRYSRSEIIALLIDEDDEGGSQSIGAPDSNDRLTPGYKMLSNSAHPALSDDEAACLLPEEGSATQAGDVWLRSAEQYFGPRDTNGLSACIAAADVLSFKDVGAGSTTHQITITPTMTNINVEGSPITMEGSPTNVVEPLAAAAHQRSNWVHPFMRNGAESLMNMHREVITPSATLLTQAGFPPSLVLDPPAFYGQIGQVEPVLAPAGAQGCHQLLDFLCHAGNLSPPVTSVLLHAVDTLTNNAMTCSEKTGMLSYLNGQLNMIVERCRASSLARRQSLCTVAHGTYEAWVQQEMDKFDALCQMHSFHSFQISAQFSASKALLTAQLQQLKDVFQSEVILERGYHTADLSTALSVFDRSERCRLALMDHVADVVRTLLN